MIGIKVVSRACEPLWEKVFLFYLEKGRGRQRALVLAFFVSLMLPSACGVSSGQPCFDNSDCGDCERCTNGVCVPSDNSECNADTFPEDSASDSAETDPSDSETGSDDDPGVDAAADSDTDSGDDSVGADTDSEVSTSCEGRPDFASCVVKTDPDPDRAYDICVDGVCVSPGCGTVSCNAPAPNFPFADTLQRSCYSESSLIDCPSEGSFFGQDAQYGWDTTRDADSRFIRNTEVSDEPIVYDSGTELTWQGCVAGRSADDCSGGSETLMSWDDALQYCNKLSWGGILEWRLPDEFALQSIVSFDASSPAVDNSAFPHTPGNFFWSSSTHADSNSEAWYVEFKYGHVNFYAKDTDEFNVRCVTGGNTVPSERFVRSGSEAMPEVTDRATGLVWQGCTAGQEGASCQTGAADKMTWSNALQYCETLSWGDASDWRLPNILELAGILDSRRYTLAVDSVAFPATEQSLYWSSTSCTNSVSDAWTASFYIGYSLDLEKSSEAAYARCVRDNS